PLPYCRQKFLRAHNCSSVIGKTETLKAGECEYRGINVTGIKLAQSRFDIAAQRQHAKIRTRAFGDRLPAQRSRSKACAACQLRERMRCGADEDIAWILALKTCRKNEPIGQYGRHVFCRMHREVHAPVEERLLDLLGEQAFAALLRQRPVLNRVAGGPDDNK